MSLLFQSDQLILLLLMVKSGSEKRVLRELSVLPSYSATATASGVSAHCQTVMKCPEHIIT